MTHATAAPSALELLASARELSASLETDVQTGRLDRLEATLDERERCLRELQAQLACLGSPLPPDVEAALQALREQDHALQDWMAREKQEVLRALASLRGQRVNPYGDAISGPVALDQRR